MFLYSQERNVNINLLAFYSFVVVQIGIVALYFFIPDPTIFIGSLLTLLFGFFILVDPRTIFLIIIFITFIFDADVIGKLYVVNILGVNWYSMDWILFFSGLAWLVRWAYGAGPRLQKTSITIPMIIFMISLPLFALLSIIFQGNKFQDVFADMRLFFYYGSFFLVLLFATDWKDFEMIFWAMIICGTIGAIPQIVQSLSQSSFDSLTGNKLFFRRITGAHEVNYPLQLIASVSMLPFVKSWGKRLLLFLSIIVSLIALYLSYTRGSWLAVVVGGIATLFILLRYSKFRKMYYSKITVTVLLVLLVLFLFEIFGVVNLDSVVNRATLISSKRIDISSLQRLTEWQLAIRVFFDHPLIGGGLGYIYRFHAIGVGELEQIFVHNSYLYVLSKMGIIGFAIFITLYGTIIKRIIKVVSKLSSAQEIGLFLSFASMLLVLLVKALTTWFLNTLTLSLFLGLLIGAIGFLDSKAHVSSLHE